MYELILVWFGMLIGQFVWAPDYSFKVYGGVERLKKLVGKFKD